MMSPAEDNRLSDVQNLLGFVLAGFGGVLSFIGLRSTEVTTVLRNNSKQASLVALLLLLSVLAAVLSIAIPSTKKVTLVRALAIAVLLLTIGPIVILLIPIQKEHGFLIPVTYVGIGVGVALLVWDLWRTKRKPSPDQPVSGEPPDRPVSSEPPDRPVSWQLVLIIASVILIACSMYGAIRLETASQLNSDVQLGAQVTKSASDTALSVHVTASKVRNIGYIGIYVLGLPSTVHMADVCSRFTTLIHRGRCIDIPCAYLGDSCERVMDGTVTPDAAGDINETLTASLITGKFQDIYVQAVVCSSEGVCQKVSQAGSRLDIHL